MEIILNAPNGKQIVLKGPDGASQEEIQNMAAQAKERAMQMPEFQPQQKTPSPMRRAGDIAQQTLNVINPATSGKLGVQALGKMQEGLDIAGEKVTEGISEKFPGVNPYLAAGAGAAVQNLPSMIPFGRAGQLAKGGAKALKAVKAARSAKRAKVPNVEAMRQQVRELPIEKARQIGKLEQTRKGWSKEIGQAREAEGITQGRMGDLPVPKNIMDFADEMKVLSGKSAKDLTRVFGKEGLADLKDTFQLLRDTGKIPQGTRISADIAKGETLIDDALGILAPKTGTALKGYRKVQSQIGSFPKDFKTTEITLRKKLAQTLIKSKGKKKAIMRKALKAIMPWLARGVVGGAGGGLAYKMLGG